MMNGCPRFDGDRIVKWSYFGSGPEAVYAVLSKSAECEHKYPGALFVLQLFRSLYPQRLSSDLPASHSFELLSSTIHSLKT